MKCVILSAGLGVRSRPLTKNIPKVMLEVGGKPALEHQINLCKKYGISEIAINLHYLPKTITNYFQDGRRWHVKIHYSYEKKLLGTAGAIKKLAKFWGKEPFLILYGDSLTNFNFKKLFFFAKKNQLANLTLFQSPEPWTQGAVKTDSSNQVIKFVEKPPKEKLFTKWVDAGVTLLNPALIKYIPDGYCELGKDFYPLLLKKVPIFALKTTGYSFRDIGSPERYSKVVGDFNEGTLVL